MSNDTDSQDSKDEIVSHLQRIAVSLEKSAEILNFFKNIMWTIIVCFFIAWLAVTIGFI